MNFFLNYPDFFWAQGGSICSFLGMLSYWIIIPFKKNKKQLFPFFPKIFILTSNFLFGLTLLSRWITAHYFPLSNLFESLIFLSWALSFLVLYFEQQTKSQTLSLLLAPVLFLLSSFSSFNLPLDMQKASALVPSLQSNWLMMHVSMMMISYATLLTGSILSVFYLCFVKFNLLSDVLKFNFLRSSSFLGIIETLSNKVISIGFPLLTLGILSGAVWANEAWGSYWSWDPKETWALITWLVFATYLHARFLKGWQGEKIAWIGSLGFFTLWICYLGVNFLGKGLHSYGWVFS